MARLPDVLSSNDLPYPELCAARLDGEIYALDGSFIPIDVLDQPGLRARSLHVWSPSALIAERRTAAWIYGALDSPPFRHQFCVDITARVRPERAARISVREVVLGDGDVARLNGVRITSPARTVTDLARIVDDFVDQIPEIITRLSSLWSVTYADCETLMDRRRNLPGKRDALTLLKAALSAA